MRERRRGRGSRGGSPLLMSALAVSFGVACAEPREQDGLGPAFRFDLIEHLPRAVLASPGPEHIGLQLLSVAGTQREALFMHPPSRAEFPGVPIPRGARLELGFGVSDQVWSEQGDGVRFSVYARGSAGRERRIFTSYIDPKHEGRDRRWVSAVAPIEDVGDSEVVLILETDPGPAGDVGWDWAGWSRVAVVSDHG